MRIFGIPITLDLSPPPTEEEVDAKLERYNELYEKDTAFIERMEQGSVSTEEWAVGERDHKEQVGLFYDLKDNGGVDWHADESSDEVEVEQEEEASTPWWKLW